jgi:hypothetical protein
MNTPQQSTTKTLVNKENLLVPDTSFFDEIFLAEGSGCKDADLIQYRLDRIINPSLGLPQKISKSPTSAVKVVLITVSLVFLTVLLMSLVLHSGDGLLGLDVEEALLVQASQAQQELLVTCDRLPIN